MLLIVIVSLSLLAHGDVQREVGATGTLQRDRSGSAGLQTDGSILDLSGPEPISRPAPDRTIALTFDDGSDATWTPRVLEVLRRHGAPATFFVVGANLIEELELARSIIAVGRDVNRARTRLRFQEQVVRVRGRP